MISTSQIANIDPNVNESLSLIQNLYLLIGVVFVIIVFAFYMIFFRMRVNKRSLRQVDYFKKNRKYIPELFVELNESKEVLRFFVWGRKWKSRIVRDYNRIFHCRDGKILSTAFAKRGYHFRLPFYSSMSTVENEIKRHKEFLSHLRENHRNNEYPEMKDEALLKVSFSIYHYIDLLNDILEKVNIIAQKAIILVGSAGNGKTNLACSLVELIISSKNACVFINSRDFRNQVEDEFVSRLHMPGKFRQSYVTILKLCSFFLLLSKRQLFVIIDAINENDNPNFKDQLITLLNKLNTVQNLKILLTCRSEFFEERFKGFTEALDAKSYIYNITASEYSDRAKLKIKSVYSAHFDFQGKISKYVSEQLLKSLLFMRMFYESYAHQREISVTLNKYSVFNKYIMYLKDHCSTEIRCYIELIARKMIESLSFDGVANESLNLLSAQQNELEKIIDGNILINKTIIKNSNTITEDIQEQFYFVFDEMRDYCIARVLINDCEIQNDYSTLFTFLDRLISIKSSVIEGIVCYSYSYFRDRKDMEHCKQLLENYTELKDIDKDGRIRIAYSPYDESSREFNHFIVSIILDTCNPLLDFERRILFFFISHSAKDVLHFFKYLLPEDNCPCIHPFSLFVDMLLSVKNLDGLKHIFGKFGSDDDHYHMENEIPNLLSGNLLSYIERFDASEVNDYFTFLFILGLVKVQAFDIIDIPSYVNVQKIADTIIEKSDCEALRALSKRYVLKH